LAKLGGPHRIDPVADGDDGIEGVEVDASGNLPVPLGLNYPEFPELPRAGSLRFRRYFLSAR
jgi:hypothetical protein